MRIFKIYYIQTVETVLICFVQNIKPFNLFIFPHSPRFQPWERHVGIVVKVYFNNRESKRLKPFAMSCLNIKPFNLFIFRHSPRFQPWEHHVRIVVEVYFNNRESKRLKPFAMFCSKYKTIQFIYI